MLGATHASKRPSSAGMERSMSAASSIPWHAGNSVVRPPFAYTFVICVVLILRPTAVIFIAVLVAHHFWNTRPKYWIKPLLIDYCAVGVPVLALSVGADWLFYGRLTLVQWNFFRLNVLCDMATQFGVHPFYWYFTHGAPAILGAHLPLIVLGVLLSWWSTTDSPADIVCVAYGSSAGNPMATQGPQCAGATPAQEDVRFSRFLSTSQADRRHRDKRDRDRDRERDRPRESGVGEKHPGANARGHKPPLTSLTTQSPYGHGHGHVGNASKQNAKLLVTLILVALYAYSFLAHKEFRFIYLLLPWSMIFAGISCAYLERLERHLTYCADCRHHRTRLPILTR